MGRSDEFPPPSEEFHSLHKSNLFQTVEQLIDALWWILKIPTLFSCGFADGVFINVDETQDKIVGMLSLNAQRWLQNDSQVISQTKLLCLSGEFCHCRIAFPFLLFLVRQQVFQHDSPMTSSLME